MPKTSKPAKIWSPSQLARLPALGYYLAQSGTVPISTTSIDIGYSRFIYIGDGRCQYSRYHETFKSFPWTTLLWTCAPTKVKIAKSVTLAPGTIGTQYLYFATFAELSTHLASVKFPYELENAPEDRSTIALYTPVASHASLGITASAFI